MLHCEICYLLSTASAALAKVYTISQLGSLLQRSLSSQLSADVTSLLSQMMYVDLVPPAPTPSQTLSAVSMVTSMPEVMETLVKRYQSLFL